MIGRQCTVKNEPEQPSTSRVSNSRASESGNFSGNFEAPLHLFRALGFGLVRPEGMPEVRFLALFIA
jgi:hypothetical protein